MQKDNGALGGNVESSFAGYYLFVPIPEYLTITLEKNESMNVKEIRDLIPQLGLTVDDSVYLDDIEKVFGYALEREELLQMEGGGLVAIWEIESGQPIETLWRGDFKDLPTFQYFDELGLQPAEIKTSPIATFEYEGMAIADPFVSENTIDRVDPIKYYGFIEKDGSLTKDLENNQVMMISTTNDENPENTFVSLFSGGNVVSVNSLADIRDSMAEGNMDFCTARYFVFGMGNNDNGLDEPEAASAKR
jgi:hypothetical protein